MTIPGDRTRRVARGAITMQDVGRLAGVSQVTVSRALSDPAKVSPQTLERIQQAIAATGFVPNALAGALASNRSMLVSALVPSLTNIVYASMLATFSAALRSSGYQLLVSETGFDAESETATIETHLSRRPDAMLLTGVHHAPRARQMLLAADIPVVEVWDITETPIDLCVGFSHRAAGRAMAEFAHDAGYRRAAALSAGDERARRRAEAFATAFAGLTGGEVVPIRTIPTAGIAQGRTLLAELLDSGERPDLVMCSSDLLAQGVLIEAAARGLAVPGDLAVLGFGDQDFAAALNPPLTTVRVDRDTLGRNAAAALLARIRGDAVADPVIDIGFTLVRRASA